MEPCSVQNVSEIFDVTEYNAMKMYPVFNAWKVEV
jgi:hypothetical protein